MVKGYLGKLSKILLFLFLLLIPTQLGKHFWFDWSLVLGIKIDYLSPTLYLIDLIWLGLFIVESLSSNKVYQVKKWFNLKRIGIVVFVLINILLATNKWVAGMGWLRIFEMGWMIWFLNKNKKIVKDLLIKVIPLWIILESILAIGQISKGGSLNGIWWWLGERSFDFNTIGIAQMSVAGSGLIRAYGTFSHPNSLAGFLLVALIWWIKFKPLKTEIIKKNIYWWMVAWLGLVGIILTGSRTIWAMTLVVLIWFLGKSFKEIKNRWKSGILILILLFLVFKIINFNYPIGGFLSGWDENGLLKRGQLNLAALHMIKESPLFGVGMKNFLINLPEFQKNNQIFWLQPVHNILLLLISEIGILGLGIITWLLFGWWKVKKWTKEDLLIIGVIVLSGMMDHYWLTLPQNMWLLVLVIGVI